jgi:hypothetical protein
LQTAYKVEIFSRALQFRAFAPIERPGVRFDYLTLEGFAITAPPVPVEKGDIAHITDSMGLVVYQGIVNEIAHGKTLSIGLLPLLSLFDLSVSYDRTDLQTGALEDFIAGILTELYITNPDLMQRIPMTVKTTSSTSSALNIKSNVHELYDIITRAFTQYGVVVSAEFLPQQRVILVSIGATPSEVVIEAELRNVLQKNIVIGDNYGRVNKLTLIDKGDESVRATYYLHTDGSVSTIDTDRIMPVFPAAEYVESEDFEADAPLRARERLSTQKHDNLIELTYRRGDRLVPAEALPIGTVAQIIDDRVYRSVLTGYEQAEQTIKLIFGNVRMDLTQKLILERRR